MFNGIVRVAQGKGVKSDKLQAVDSVYLVADVNVGKISKGRVIVKVPKIRMPLGDPSGTR